MMIKWYVVNGGSCASASAHRQSSCSSTLWSPGIPSLILSYHSAATRFWTHRAHRSRVLSPEPNSPLVSTQQSLQASMDSLPLLVVADRDRLSNLLTSQLLVPCMFIIRETKRKQTEVLHTMYSYLYGWCCCGGVDELTYLSLRIASLGLQAVAELLWNGVVWSSSAWSAAFLQHHDDQMVCS